MGKRIISWIGSIYKMGAVKRSVIIWVSFQSILWLVFGIGYFTNSGAWVNVPLIAPTTAAVGGWGTTCLFILASNLFICLLIIAGNIFVRFSVVTPGIVVLVIQAVMIGWVAGTNGFEVPFASVGAANLEYLKIGLWETTAYAIACAVTLPKSLNIADTFPAKKWSEVRKFRDIRLNATEIIILILGGISIVGAAVIETIALMG